MQQHWLLRCFPMDQVVKSSTTRKKNGRPSVLECKYNEITVGEKKSKLKILDFLPGIQRHVELEWRRYTRFERLVLEDPARITHKHVHVYLRVHERCACVFMNESIKVCMQAE